MDRNELEKSRLKQRKRKKAVGRKISSRPTKRPRISDRKKFERKPRVQESIANEPVLGDVTQGFKDTIQSVIDEGGSPKLTTTEARVDRITDKLTKPKLALRGGGRAYGKNS